MYVWFDALINYISTLGWPQNKKIFDEYWPGIQVAGKDNLRQQSAMWQGMLMSAGLPLSKQIFIHGFITTNGQKMSKSLGNVVDPYKIIKQYGTDSVRFYLLREISAYDDGDYSDKRMKELYDSELANELGNLVSRLTTLGETDEITIAKTGDEEVFDKTIQTYFDAFNFPTAVSYIWQDVKKLNKDINTFEPWKKEKNQRKEFLEKSIIKLNLIAQRLLPIIPTSAEKIISFTQGSIKKSPPFFPRI
jgi:methionyl-tRNA synthetase